MTRLGWAAAMLALSAIACGGNKTTTPTTTTPNYNGGYSGSYTVASCTQDGQFATLGLCTLFTNGSVLPYGIVMNQTDRNVQGNFILGSVNFGYPSTPIASDGSLTITGAGTDADFGTTVNVVPTWVLHVKANVLSGAVTQVWTATGFSGQGTVVGNISTAIKNTGISAQQQPSAAIVVRSVQDVWSAVTTLRR